MAEHLREYEFYILFYFVLGSRAQLEGNLWSEARIPYFILDWFLDFVFYFLIDFF